MYAIRSYYEYFPAKYTRQKDTSNYETHAQLAEALHVDHIDFNRYFVNQKYVSPYPLFGQFGIHWSYYGMCLVADSLIRYMEHKRHIDMPNAYWTEIELHQPRGGDYDIGNGLNILRHFKSYDMAYPNIRFESDTNKTRPSLLVISDSFYWGIYDRITSYNVCYTKLLRIPACRCMLPMLPTKK